MITNTRHIARILRADTTGCLPWHLSGYRCELYASIRPNRPSSHTAATPPPSKLNSSLARLDSLSVLWPAYTFFGLFSDQLHLSLEAITMSTHKYKPEEIIKNYNGVHPRWQYTPQGLQVFRDFVIDHDIHAFAHVGKALISDLVAQLGLQHAEPQKTVVEKVKNKLRSTIQEVGQERAVAGQAEKGNKHQDEIYAQGEDDVQEIVAKMESTQMDQSELQHEGYKDYAPKLSRKSEVRDLRSALRSPFYGLDADQDLAKIDMKPSAITQLDSLHPSKQARHADNNKVMDDNAMDDNAVDDKVTADTVMNDTFVNAEAQQSRIASVPARSSQEPKEAPHVEHALSGKDLRTSGKELRSSDLAVGNMLATSTSKGHEKLLQGRAQNRQQLPAINATQPARSSVASPSRVPEQESVQVPAAVQTTNEVKEDIPMPQPQQKAMDKGKRRAVLSADPPPGMTSGEAHALCMELGARAMETETDEDVNLFWGAVEWEKIVKARYSPSPA